MRHVLGAVALVLLVTPCLAAQYDIKRESDGPFQFKLYGVDINKGSTLQRESVLFNDPTCPVQISRNSMTFDYSDRRLTIAASTQIAIRQPVMAMEVRHILFDVFGQHMRNLSNTEARDFSVGASALKATWNLYDENDASEHLTTVSYISRARLVDGTQWIVNIDNLTAALGSLHLERKIEDEIPPKTTP